MEEIHAAKKAELERSHCSGRSIKSEKPRDKHGSHGYNRRSRSGDKGPDSSKRKRSPSPRRRPYSGSGEASRQQERLHDDLAATDACLVQQIEPFLQQPDTGRAQAPFLPPWKVRNCDSRLDDASVANQLMQFFITEPDRSKLSLAHQYSNVCQLEKTTFHQLYKSFGSVFSVICLMK